MPRQQRDVRLQTRDARRQLPRRQQPYWHELRRGLTLGYYKGPAGGTWLLREYKGKGNRPQRRVGLADDQVPADGETVFSWAQVLSLALGADRPTAHIVSAYSVSDGLEDYWKSRHAKSPSQSVEIDKSKAQAHISNKLRDKQISELTTGDLQQWYDAMVPATDDREKQRRAKASADRVRRLFFAVLNNAYRNQRKAVPSADAWRAVKTFRDVDRARTRFLSVAEAKRLLNAMPPDFRRLARGALYTGLRLAELLALRAADITDGQVRVRHSKSGKPRSVPLSAEGVDFFDGVTAGKAGDAPIFLRDTGDPWKPMHISRAMKSACEAGKVAPRAVFHDLRRSYGSLLLNAGTDVEVIQELLGHADMRMTRRAYAHLLNATVAKQVKKRLPSFGLERTNVRKLRP
jgi:integrase